MIFGNFILHKQPRSSPKFLNLDLIHHISSFLYLFLPSPPSLVSFLASSLTPQVRSRHAAVRGGALQVREKAHYGTEPLPHTALDGTTHRYHFRGNLPHPECLNALTYSLCILFMVSEDEEASITIYIFLLLYILFSSAFSTLSYLSFPFRLQNPDTVSFFVLFLLFFSFFFLYSHLLFPILSLSFYLTLFIMLSRLCLHTITLLHLTPAATP